MTDQRYGVPFWLGPEDARVACLLVHGFSGSPMEMRGLGESLAAHGVRVYGMTVAGHSGKLDEMIRAGRRQWLASVEEGLAQLAPYQRVFVAGLSMGGVLALRLAIQHPTRITGVIAMSTPTRFADNWQTRAVPIARYFIKWFYPLERLDFNDPKVQANILKEARMRDPNVVIDFSDAQTVTTLKQMVRLPIPALAELFALTNQTRHKLGSVRSPLLIIHSKRDQTVNPSCADELYRLTTTASPKTLYWLQRSDHVITTDVEHEQVYQLAWNFITDPSTAVTLAQSQHVQQEVAGETHLER